MLSIVVLLSPNFLLSRLPSLFVWVSLLLHVAVVAAVIAVADVVAIVVDDHLDMTNMHLCVFIFVRLLFFWLLLLLFLFLLCNPEA